MTHSDILEWRQRLGLSQRAAAKALGVSLRTYQVWERGSDFATGAPSVIDRRSALVCAAVECGLSPAGKPAPGPR